MFKWLNFFFKVYKNKCIKCFDGHAYLTAASLDNIKQLIYLWVPCSKYTRLNVVKSLPFMLPAEILQMSVKKWIKHWEI